MRNPIAIDVKIHGVNRVIARMNRIVANIKQESKNSGWELLEEARKEARKIINQKTDGSGTLADSLKIKTFEDKKTGGFRFELGPTGVAKKYAKYVHDGFEGHWTRAENLKDWLIKHPMVKPKKASDGNYIIEVGYPKTGVRRDGGAKQSAQWLVEGGVKFFDKAFINLKANAKKTFKKGIKKAIRGR